VSYRTYVLAILTAIAFLNGADQSVMASVTRPVSREFRLDDTQLGLLGSVFILVYALAIVPFGAWADAGKRSRVMAAGVAVWSLATLAGGLAVGYVHLLAARAAVGAGEASYLPAGNSLIGDMFRREERARALAWVSGGLRAGVGIGLIGGGLVASRLGWRAAFLFAGVPGLFLAFLALRLKEPARGGSETVKATRPVGGEFSWMIYRGLLRIPTALAVIATVTFGFWVTAGIGYWIPIFVQRRFEVGVGQAGGIAGLPLLVGGLVGTFGGAWLVDRLTRRRASGAFEVTAAAFVLGAGFAAIAFSTRALPLFIASYLVMVTCLGVFIPALQAVAQSVILPTQRATGVTLALLLGNLLGNAIAPFAVGALSDAIGDLGRSLLIATVSACILAALASAAGIRNAGRDARRMDEAWARLAAGGVPASEVAP
jgi:MFS transporter, Spinster family, sphingosine-1-phosphate transporter